MGGVTEADVGFPTALYTGLTTWLHWKYITLTQDFCYKYSYIEILRLLITDVLTFQDLYVHLWQWTLDKLVFAWDSKQHIWLDASAYK